jgi:hypothetical protein
MTTGHFSGKFFSKVSTLGHSGSNDTDLKPLSCPGAESIKVQTNKFWVLKYRLHSFEFSNGLRYAESQNDSILTKNYV